MSLVSRDRNSSVSRCSTRPALHISVVLIVMLGLFGAAASAERQAVATTIRGIEIGSRGDASVVTIAGNGSLPPPSIGVVDGPPRIFLDFLGVRPGAIRIPPSQHPRIKRVRVALNNANPLITRVVIDLLEPQPHIVEEEAGRLRIIVGGSPSLSPASAALKPVPPLPEAPAPATAMNSASGLGARTPPTRPQPAPVETPAPPVAPPAPAPSRPPGAPIGSPPPAKDLERYRRQASAPIDRLLMQQPLLTTLDSSEDQTEERMQMGVEEFERLRQELAAIRPPETLRPQHDMLLQVSTLGLMSTRLRLESLRTKDPNAIKNAASAAAGAIILLERACADLSIPVRVPQP